MGSALCVNHSLIGLSLWKNRIFHSGAEALANGLAANTSLSWLGVGEIEGGQLMNFTYLSLSFTPSFSYSFSLPPSPSHFCPPPPLVGM